MATRKSEWLASIKPILDRDGAKRDAAALAKELGDILEINIDANPENLKQLADEFNRQLSKMGKQPIVFSEKTLNGIVNQFANAITEGIAKGIGGIKPIKVAPVGEGVGNDIGRGVVKGIVDGIKDGVAESSADILKQLETLTKRRNELNEQSVNLDKRYRKYERLANVSSKDYDRFKPLELSKDVDIDEQAQQIMGQFIDAEDALNEATRGTKEYNTALIKALEAAEKLYQMSHTLRNNKNLVKDKTLLSDFDFTNLSDVTADVFDKADVDFNKFLRDFDKYYHNKLNTIHAELNQIETTMASLQKQRIELIDEEKANEGLKSVKEIEEAYSRILKKKKSADKVQAEINAALGYTPGDESLKVLSNRYKTSVTSGQDWEVQYQWMVKFVKEYEAYLAQIDAEEDKIKKKNMRARAKNYAELYGDLKPLVGGAENALRGISDMAGGVKVRQDAGAVENAQKIRDSAAAKAQHDQESAKATANIRNEVEATVQAEAESLEFAKQKSVVNEVSADAAKAELDITKQTTAELEKQQKILLYRRVEGEFDPNRISNRSIDALYNKQNQPTIQEALEFGFGGFGDGFYGSVLSGAENLALDTSGGKMSFAEFDVSDYNFYVNKTVEQAESLREFLLSLQKLVGADTLLDTSELTDIKDLSEDQLFEKAQQIFENFSMSKEQFHTWLENAKKESEVIAGLFAKGEVPSDRHNFGTRFMKALGYQGVLNNTGDDEYDGNYQGSVIYDPDVDKMKASMVVFKSTGEYLEHIGSAAQSADQAVDDLNKSFEQTEQLTSGGSGSGNGDASSAELEAERAKAESIQNELNKKNSELAEKDNEIQRIKSEKDIAIQVANEEKQTIQNDLDAATQLNENVRRQLLDTRAELSYTERRADEAEERASQLERRVAESSNIYGQSASISGTALDSRLVEIKSVLDSINQKIVDGGKIFNRDAAKQAYKESQQDNGSQSQRQSNVFKPLQRDYESAGKLSAQFASEGNLETKAALENIKKTIAQKREELKLTMEQNTALRAKYRTAFDAEKRLLDAAKAQAEIDKQNRQDDKDWKKRVKDAQRATGINAATTAVNAGDQTVLRAIGADGVSKDIEKKAQDLSEQIKVLRTIRDEIAKKGEKASEQDRDDLSKQITKVKELKTEVDSYLKIHEKYSGEGSTQFYNVDTSNFGAVGTDQYWNNITAAIKGVSEGRVTIKGMNTDTGELTGTTKIAANTFAEWSAVVDPLTGKLSMVRTGIKKTESLMTQISRKTKEIFTYFSGSSMIFKAFNEIKKGVQYVRDIDLALTELKKVTDETEETYRKFLDTASKTAEKVGSTMKDVISSTADWARLGSVLAKTSISPLI